jgi:hypothetical protein
MNLSQRKLNKSEWNSVEIPVSQDEKSIINMIVKGYHDPNFAYNPTKTIMNHLKIEKCSVNEMYIYNVYIHNRICNLIKKYNLDYSTDELPINKKKINKINIMRIENNSKDFIKNNTDDVFEFKLLDILSKMLKYKAKEQFKWCVHYYTLCKLIYYNIESVNSYFTEFMKYVLEKYVAEIDILAIIANAKEYVECNEYLLKYQPNKLYTHQKEIFSIFSNINNHNKSKLVLYMAPTATGKTLTPIALTEKYRVIFVCAARHVGVALAKSAISVGKKIAFAFGCETADDIRLHYFAAKTYQKNYKTGGIYRVDNSDGANVELIICDIKSYLCAMRYMSSFNDELGQTDKDMIMFWDEPTITMDYESHECHEYISKNWDENTIPNIVLSSATLPKANEINRTINNFKAEFNNAQVFTITSSECKKSIQLIDANGKVILPHLNIQNYEKLKNCLLYCSENKSIYRYFDLHHISQFISILHEDDMEIVGKDYNVYEYFDSIKDIEMESIKEYYFTILNKLTSKEWDYVYNKFINYERLDYKLIKINEKFPSISNGMNITTCDAYTLTDGPTIFIAEDVEKIAKYCIQQSKLPQEIVNKIYSDIKFNNTINKEIIKLNKSLEDLIQKDVDEGNEKKIARDKPGKDPVQAKLRSKINELNSLYRQINIDPVYIPNKLQHIYKWTESNHLSSFTSTISNQDVQRIMELDMIEDIWKILLLMGIGLFSKEKPIEYTEIVKEFADNQKLYLIIANGDYIYGTNYQFCHSFIGKDLFMTQEKLIQAMGRVGRNKLQQTYSIRLRNNEVIQKLLFKEENKIETLNMNKLFNTMRNK